MPISRGDILQQFRSGNPYLVFDGPVSAKTPRDFIPLIDTIRKESDWRNTCLPVRKDKNGNYKPIVRSGLYFGFTPLVSVTDVQLLAIETGKKCTYYPSGVYELVRQGCAYDDFASLGDAVIAYCEALRLRSDGLLKESLIQSQKAFQLQPQESLYATLYFETRLELKDDSVIDEELKYFAGDIDVLVHSGRVYRWLRYLVNRKNQCKALELIHLINKHLDDLIAGKKQHRIYASDRTESYLHYKNKFNEKIEKLRLKLESSSTFQNR